MKRCAGLTAVLAEHAGAGEEMRRVPDVVLDAVRDADVVRAIVPSSLGGHGLGLRTLCEGTRELARGCPATGWTVSFLMLHAWMLSRFPAAFREELFAGGNVPTAAAPLAPTGSLRGADGGYVVSGRWEWATAVNHSDWCIVHGFDDTAEFGTRFAAVPVESLTIEDTWFTSGMRATGSNVVVDEVFVPTERACSGDELRGAGSGVADDHLASLPLMSVLALTASASAVGAVEAAVAHHRDRLTKRVLAYSLGDKASDQPLSQSRLAAVTSDLETLLAGWRSAIDEVEFVAAHSEPDEMLRVRTRLAAAAAVRGARVVIGTVGEGAGASAYVTDNPFQRLQRDVETLKGHVVFDWDRTTELAGRVMLGHPLRPTDMA